MKTKLGTILLTVFFLMTIIEVNAQREDQSLLDVSLNTGVTTFYGDVKQYRIAPYREDYRQGLGVNLEKRLNNLWGVGGQLLIGKLHGTNTKNMDLYPNGTKFSAEFIEHNIFSTFYISKLFTMKNINLLDVYLRLGIGFTHWRTDLYDYKTDKKIGGNGQAGKGMFNMTTEAVMPVGIGMKVNLSDRWNLNFETSIRPVNTDKLDGLESGKKVESYTYTSGGLTYRIYGKRKNLPDNPDREFLAMNKIKEKDTTTSAKPDFTDLNLIDESMFDYNDSAIQTEPPVVEDNPKTEDPIGELYEMEEPADEEPAAKIESSFKSNNGMIYKVQILAVQSGPVDIDKYTDKYYIPGPVDVEKTGVWHKYLTGYFTDYENALSYCVELVNKGVYDAFVVSYRNGERLGAFRP
ncbi:MAG: outer membrane beta-barrel protein [Bacteroidales bacterium]|nr:outer membrane beta-barrel protein [Bacteroidales bacterium]MCF8344786.1 outer membrane beta-barrel protein [Bacteroidales bacterium]MCF8376132.1 outer membrane beta-barrel protein [Bacteroidales bacterium]